MRHRDLLSPTTSSIAGDRLVRLRDVVRGVASSASPNRNKTGGPRANTKTHNATTPRVTQPPGTSRTIASTPAATISRSTEITDNAASLASASATSSRCRCSAVVTALAWFAFSVARAAAAFSTSALALLHSSTSKVLTGAQVVFTTPFAVSTRFRASTTASSETGATTDLTMPWYLARLSMFSWRDTCEAPRLFLTTLAPATAVATIVKHNKPQTTRRNTRWDDGTNEIALGTA